MPRVIIVSNRLPVTVKKIHGKLDVSPSSGGLATGMSFYTKRRGSLWIGWPGIVSEELTEADKQEITRILGRYNCAPVFLTQKQVDAYYNGFSNSVLWPLLHNLPLKVEPNEHDWQVYRKVNRQFAEAVIALVDAKSTIWVHDYQLMLVPEILTDNLEDSNVGFFLHTPFPDVRNAQNIPHLRSLVRGLLGADLVGFHTTAYANNFLDVCHELKAGITTEDQVILPTHSVRVTDFPISIDYYKFAETADTPEVQREIRMLKKQYGRYKIILTVDRLDLTKGFLERLSAYREFLQQNPRLHGKVIMLMLAVPSRTDIDAYRELKEQVEAEVESIQREFGTKKWQPIVYMYKSVPFEELSALYQVADIAFITPLRDGMNLVAKEYVASKRNRNGVLILSQTAGAAQELTDALLVNPAKPATLVTALGRAVRMQPGELRGRIGSMQEQLASYTVNDWARNFMRTLQQPVPMPTLPSRTNALNTRIQRDIKTIFDDSSHRLLLFDYDGVLAHFRSNPRSAVPTKTVVTLLQKLAKQSDTELVVISGRSKDDLDEWFGNLPIGLAAEHGAAVKRASQKWHNQTKGTASWKREIKPILEHYAKETPGAFVEVKDSSLVWHYRSASAYYTQKHLVILRKILKPLATKYNLGLFNGNKIFEVKPLTITKSHAAQYWLKKHHDFILAIGDDYTDEDMFSALPDQAISIKVGRGKTIADYRLAGVEEVLQFLRILSKR